MIVMAKQPQLRESHLSVFVTMQVRYVKNVYMILYNLNVLNPLRNNLKT